MRLGAADLWARIDQIIEERVIPRLAARRYLVNSVSAGLTKLKEIDGTVHDQDIARLYGFHLDPDDEVMVIEVPAIGRDGQRRRGSTRLVLGLLQRIAGTRQEFDYPIDFRSRDGDDTAFIRFVQADGTVFAQFDTLNTRLELVNSGSIRGFADSGATGTFEITGANGDASFSGTVEADQFVGATFNSPILWVEGQDNPDTATTSSTSVYASASSVSITLTDGIWTVMAVGWLDLRHTASGTAAASIDIAGTRSSDTVFRAPGSAVTDQLAFRPSHIRTGLTSGSKVIDLGFRASDAGTVTADNPTLVIMAWRTA